MLHARLRGRQVHVRLIAAAACLFVALQGGAASAASRGDDLAAADALSRAGQHAEAAALYESVAKRPLFRWDTRATLLAAREYHAAGQIDDAERVLEKVRDDVRGDDAVLLARVAAEVALARGRPEAALTALARLPEPWPAPLAAELLGLRAQAEFAAGRMIDGIRTTERRSLVLGTADARHSNYAQLVEALTAAPTASSVVPPDASPSERGWLELGQLLVSAPNDASDPAPPGAATDLAQRAADWRARHPNHPGGEFLPAAAGSIVAGRGEIAAGPANVIALILPLSGRQQAAGIAVRDGFLAAALGEGAAFRPRIVVIDTATGGPASAYARALADGAQAVAGPLTKDDVTALVNAGPLPVPTLALNTWPGQSPPPFLFQYALDPEQEARAAARRIVGDGHSRGVALFPLNAWGDRLRAAFTSELAIAGVDLTAVGYYDPASADFTGPLRAALGRFGGAGDRGPDGALVQRDSAAEALAGPQFVFIAATAPAARALVPQLRFQMTYAVPVYSTSDAWEATARSAPDIEGLVFPEMPWLLYSGQGALELWDTLHTQWVQAGRGRLRLYAFGYDAYRLLRSLNAAVRGGGLVGLTGQLSVEADGRVRRELEWAQIQAGRPQPAGVLVQPASTIDP
jgi:outer membrane PBP1 activator LpoA protein